MDLVQNCSELPVHFDGLCDCTKHTLQYGTLSRGSVSSVLTTVVGEFDNDETVASFTAAILTSFPLYDLRGNVLPDDHTWLIVSQRRLV